MYPAQISPAATVLTLRSRIHEGFTRDTVSKLESLFTEAVQGDDDDTIDAFYDLPIPTRVLALCTAHMSLTAQILFNTFVVEEKDLPLVKPYAHRLHHHTVYVKDIDAIDKYEHIIFNPSVKTIVAQSPEALHVLRARRRDRQSEVKLIGSYRGARGWPP